MANVYQSVTELIGHTPLLAAKNFAKAHDLSANIVVKLEYQSCGLDKGSHCDRDD